MSMRVMHYFLLLLVVPCLTTNMENSTLADDLQPLAQLQGAITYCVQIKKQRCHSYVRSLPKNLRKSFVEKYFVEQFDKNLEASYRYFKQLIFLGQDRELASLCISGVSLSKYVSNSDEPSLVAYAQSCSNQACLKTVSSAVEIGRQEQAFNEFLQVLLYLDQCSHKQSCSSYIQLMPANLCTHFKKNYSALFYDLTSTTKHLKKMMKRGDSKLVTLALEAGFQDCYGLMWHLWSCFRALNKRVVPNQTALYQKCSERTVIKLCETTTFLIPSLKLLIANGTPQPSARPSTYFDILPPDLRRHCIRQLTGFCGNDDPLATPYLLGLQLQHLIDTQNMHIAPFVYFLYRSAFTGALVQKLFHGAYDDTLRYFLALKNIDCNSVGDGKYNRGHTRLEYAIFTGDKNTFQLLLTASGIDINKQSKYHVTPLIRAIYEDDHFFVTQLLARPEIDVNTPSKNDIIPLSCAAYKGRTEIVKLLLQVKNINLMQEDTTGKTALDYVANPEIKELIQAALNEQRKGKI